MYLQDSFIYLLLEQYELGLTYHHVIPHIYAIMQDERVALLCVEGTKFTSYHQEKVGYLNHYQSLSRFMKNLNFIE